MHAAGDVANIHLTLLPLALGVIVTVQLPSQATVLAVMVICIETTVTVAPKFVV